MKFRLPRLLCATAPRSKLILLSDRGASIILRKPKYLNDTQYNVQESLFVGGVGATENPSDAQFKRTLEYLKEAKPTVQS